MSAGVLFLNTMIFVSASFRLNARAMSNSQLFPGKTGITTFGFAFPIFAVKVFLASAKLGCSLRAYFGSAGCSFAPLTGGKTVASFDSHDFSISSRAIVAPKTDIDFSSWVVPILVTVPSTKSEIISRASELSTMIEP